MDQISSLPSECPNPFASEPFSFSFSQEREPILNYDMQNGVVSTIDIEPEVC